MGRKENRSRPLAGDLALFSLTAVWGCTFVTVKAALSHADSFSFLALRFLIGAVLATAIAGRRMKHWPSVCYGLVLGVLLFLGFLCQTTGLRLTTPSRSAFITGLSVVLVPFVGLLLYRRWPTLSALLGVAMAVVGLYWLTRAEEGNTVPTLRGDALTFACAIAFSFHISLTEQFIARSEGTALVATQLWVVGVLAAACLPFVHPRVEWNTEFIAALAFCGVFASALAINIQTWGQARTTAVRAALIFSLEPVFAAFYSAGTGVEHLGPRELIGGSLIVVGVLASELGALLAARGRAQAQE